MEPDRDASFALADALASDLRDRFDGGAPIVVYAWTRPTSREQRTRTLMFAKLFLHHRSEIVEAGGPDADSAYQQLVDRSVAWAKAWSQAPGELAPDDH